MIFESLAIDGAKLIRLEPRADDRGSFARLFCVDELRQAGIEMNIAQINMGKSMKKGTLRGMHMQIGESAEQKFFRCIRGKVFDVFVDVRPESPTYLKHVGVELSEENGLALYIPPGCAHGYLTLEDDSVVMYAVQTVYAPLHERGYRWNDPAFQIEWPMEPLILTEKDRSWPDYQG